MDVAFTRRELKINMSVVNAVDLSKSIIHEFHKHFLTGDADNYEHVMAVKRIITATRRHFPNESNEIEKVLLDYALGLFEEEWLSLAEEEEDDECDTEEELEEARRVFLGIYKTEKDIDL
jgi:hypothetical protein